MLGSSAPFYTGENWHLELTTGHLAISDRAVRVEPVLLDLCNSGTILYSRYNYYAIQGR